MQTTITSKGQVTIPRDLRQYLGLKQGMAVTFEIEGDHIALRAAPAPEKGTSGFGLIQSRRQAIPPDFDVASLLNAAP
jgi:AbrB family looped-hinge helix DNA binding protein